MGITDTVGLGVGASQHQTLVTGSHGGGQRLIVGSSGLQGAGGSTGLRGEVDSDSYSRDVGAARGEDVASLYGHRLAVRREEDIASSHRSFVAYVGGEVHLHAVDRDEEVAHGATGISSSTNPLQHLSTIARRSGGGDHEESNAIEAWPTAVGILSRTRTSHHHHHLLDHEDPKENATSASMRVLDVSSFDLPNTALDHNRLESAAEGDDRHQQFHLQKAEISTLRQRSSLGSTACQDCGNQAKKDCMHVRCRTCCKSRGFDCPTHIRSTWVPAARRREKQQAELAAIMAGQPRPKFKRSRTLALTGMAHAATSHTSTSAGSPPRSTSDFNLPPQEAKFRETLPPEVKAQAVFKCVRVTGVEDGQDEYAYQAVVKIGGHIFKGILYDQGVDKGDLPSSIAELQLGGRSTQSSTALIDLAGIYGHSEVPF